MTNLSDADLDRIETILGAVAPGLPWASRPTVLSGDEDATDVIHHGLHHGNVNASIAENITYEPEATLIEHAPEWLAALVAEVRAGRAGVGGVP